MLSWRWASSKVFGRVGAQVGAFGEVVAQKAVYVLVGAALPGRVRVGEVDIDRCLLRQLFGFGGSSHFGVWGVVLAWGRGLPDD